MPGDLSAAPLHCGKPGFGEMTVVSDPDPALAPPGLAPVMGWDEPLPALERELTRLGVHCVNIASGKPGTAFTGYVDTGRGFLLIFRGMNWTGIPPSPFNDKNLTKEMLNSAGFPTPIGKFFGKDRHEQALAWYRRSGLQKVVVKPNSLKKGRGIGSDINSAEELQFYLRNLPRTSFLIEEHVSGDDHRLLVVGGRFVAAPRRRAAHVVGDGRSTIAELVARKNAIRRENPVTARYPLRLDAVARHLLGRVGLEPGSVPADGRVVWLRTASNVGSGGEHEEVTDRVHRCYIDMAERIAQTLARPYSVIGIDIMCRDISSADCLGDARITEIEGEAGLFGHSRPAFGDGPPRNVLRRLAEHVLRRYDIHPEFRSRSYRITGDGLDGYGDWLNERIAHVGLGGHAYQIEQSMVECDLTGGRTVLDHFMRSLLVPMEPATVRMIDCIRDQPAPPGSIATLPERR